MPPPQPVWLELDALHFAYGRNEILKDCSLSIRQGEWVGLAGLNGAGKTTLLRCAAGLLKPQSGCVRVAGIELLQDPPAARRKLGMMVAADEVPPELELDQYLDLVRSAHHPVQDSSIVQDLYQGFGLSAFGKRRLAACSLGTRQKAAILAAFIGQPGIVLLDEPFNALDGESQQVAKQAFAAFLQHGALLMASHTIEIMHEWCSRLDCLARGRIVDSIDLNAWREAGQRSRDLEQRWLTRR